MEFLQKIGDFLWSVPLISLLLLCGIVLTFRLGFVQVRKLFAAFRLLFRENAAQGEISAFESFCTTLAGTLGTGNVAGVATAVAAVSVGGGGPGALFWMALSGFFSMATIYAEGLLSIRFRRRNRAGGYDGGPFYYIEALGPRWKPLAAAFAFFGMAAAILGIGTSTQFSSIADAVGIMMGGAGGSFMIFGATYRTVPVLAALALAVTAMFIVNGGIKRIGRTMSLIVPFMSFFYMVGVAVVVCGNIEKLPGAISLIFTEAFSTRAIAGGAGGSVMLFAMRRGVARGLFSNEAGLGSTPIASASSSNTPMGQGLVSMSSTFIDTLVMCMATGIVIIITGANETEHFGLGMTVHAFEKGIPFAPWIGRWVVTLGLVMFAFSTIPSWCYYGEKCAQYLFGAKSVRLYRMAYGIFLCVGAFLPVAVVWALGDIFNAFMAVPNILALFALSPVVAAETKKGLGRY